MDQSTKRKREKQQRKLMKVVKAGDWLKNEADDHVENRISD